MINIKDGYRLLGDEETIQDGDFGSSNSGTNWFRADGSQGQRAAYSKHYIWIRKIDMSNPSQKYDPLLNKWARTSSLAIVQLRQLTNKGLRIVEYDDGTVNAIEPSFLQILDKCTGYNWKEEKTLVVGCKTLSKCGNLVVCNGLAICNLSFLSNAISCIKSASKTLNSVCESMLFTDNRGQHHSVKFSDIENFLKD